MESLKKFFINHGEKVVLAIVVIIFGYSIIKMVSHDSNVLDLPKGKSAKVNPEDILGDIKKAQNHLQANIKVMPDPQAEKVSYQLLGMILSGDIKNAKLNLEWFDYIQPSPVGAPPLFAKPEVKSAQNIPAQYRTRFGNPQNIQVFASVNKTLVVCRGSEYLNYPKPESRRMYLWRKAIGSGKAKLNVELRKTVLRSPRTEPVVQTEESPAASSASSTKPANTMDGAPEGAPAEKTDTAKKSTGLAGFGITFDQPVKQETQTTENFTYADYKAKVENADLRAHKDMMTLCTPESVITSAWELISPKMHVLKVEPTAETIKEIMTNGINPDLVEMTESEIADYEAKKSAAEKGEKKKAVKPKVVEPKTSADWDGIMAPTVTVKKAAEAAEEQAAPQEETIQPKYYIYIDDSVQQNMVYRYAAIASLQPNNPPAELMEKEEYSTWNIYCEVDGVLGLPPEGGAFAPVARFVKEIFEKEMSKKTKGVIGQHLPFEACYISGSSGSSAAAKPATKDASGEAGKTDTAQDTGPKVRIDLLRNDKGARTPLAWAYHNQENCFSDFVYTDVVLTPKEFEFELLGAFGGNEAAVTLKVHKVEQSGETISSAFRITPPNPANSPVWSDFLKKDEGGKPVWPPKILSLTEVYNAKGNFDLVPIGENIPRRGDFTSGWGVVEIRPFIVKGNVMRFKNDEWSVIGPIPEKKDFAVIIAELNPPKGQPRRFARIYRPGPASKSPESRRLDYEYIWEPELSAKIEQRKKDLKDEK